MLVLKIQEEKKFFFPWQYSQQSAPNDDVFCSKAPKTARGENLLRARMERSAHMDPSLLPLHNPATVAGSSSASLQWPTIDGPLGLSEEESETYARRFYKFGFLLLPWLWAVNCFYFWPVLRRSRSFPSFRRCNYSVSLSFFLRFLENFVNGVLDLLNLVVHGWRFRNPISILMIMCVVFCFIFSFAHCNLIFKGKLFTHFNADFIWVIHVEAELVVHFDADAYCSGFPPF